MKEKMNVKQLKQNQNENYHWDQKLKILKLGIFYVLKQQQNWVTKNKKRNITKYVNL